MNSTGRFLGTKTYVNHVHLLFSWIVDSKRIHILDKKE